MSKLLLIAFLLFSSSIFAQKKVTLAEEIENLSLWAKNIVPLESDSNCSSFIIRVEDVVKPHYHAKHTETIYIISGSAEMQLGDTIIKVKAGDYINIPPNTVHSVKVTSIDYLDVLSIQSPKFEGKDRIWVKE